MTFTTFGLTAGSHLRPSRPYFAGEIPDTPSPREGFMYQAPKLERLGTFREVTRAGGEFLAADATNPYHRYSAQG